MTETKRLLFIDVTRGLLILCMILFHALYMAVMFKLSGTDLWSGFWWWFARIVAAGFVLLAGWSYAAQSASAGKAKRYPDLAKRALKLGIVAALISIVTFFAFGNTGFVFFGVIHLITVCYLAAWPLRNRPVGAAFSAVLVLAAGLLLGRYSFSWPWLSWLGFRPQNLYPADYLPLLPWAAWFLAGIALHPLTARLLPAPLRTSAGAGRKAPAFPLRLLAYAGRHSLAIYLVHLPALYVLAWLLSLLIISKPR